MVCLRCEEEVNHDISKNKQCGFAVCCCFFIVMMLAVLIPIMSIDTYSY